VNAFRQLIKTAGGHPPIGTWIASASPLVAEAVGQAGFEWCMLDMEHSPLELMNLLHLLHAVGATKMVPVVRVPANDRVTIKRVLDIGVTTLQVPFIQNAEEARLAVAATRYAPHGVRGLDTSCRAAHFGRAPTHLRTANQAIGLIAELENMEALDQLEAVGAVDGIDALFVGPGDLSASMGYIGQFTHPALMDVMAQAVQRAKQIGKPIGTVGPTPEMVAQYRAIGFDFVAVGSDIGLLMRAAYAALTALRTQDSVHVHTLASGTQTMAGA
jgi:2-keto-3-deoxy-L-rhamnonate aldolase RhmA